MSESIRWFRLAVLGLARSMWRRTVSGLFPFNQVGRSWMKEFEIPPPVSTPLHPDQSMWELEENKNEEDDHHGDE